MDGYMTASEAAAFLNVSERRVLELIEQERLAAHKFGKAWAITRSTVEAYAATPRKAGRPRKGHRHGEHRSDPRDER